MIRMYENIVPTDFCDYLIEKFEKEPNIDKSYDVFHQLEIQNWKEESQNLINVCKELALHYGKIYDPLKMMPVDRKIESVRIKRYTPNEHRFPLHVDVGYSGNCTRYLAFLIYLNDNEAGTKFYTPEGHFTFEAKCGNILVFPPMWLFPHEGLMPTKTNKYIASTYFHYI
jgi:prolyl 4-hydroxylase